MPSGRDALVGIRVYHDGYCGPSALLVLHLIGVRGAVKNVASRVEIRFFDVEKLKNEMFRLSFILEEKKKWSVKFKDFDFYLHEYKKNEPHE